MCNVELTEVEINNLIAIIKAFKFTPDEYEQAIRPLLIKLAQAQGKIVDISANAPANG